MFERVPRRERELLEALLSGGPATAVELRARLTDPPSNSAVRALLARLERRGLVSHDVRDQAYVYRLVSAEGEARKAALDRFVATFFSGSPTKAALTLLGDSQPSEEEIRALEALVAKARRTGGR